jgi:CBS domain containing-hemolysin-like protein
VWFVPETARLDAVLAQFRQRRNQMAIVVDEYGGTAGLVTLEDVLEEIVGNIPDRREEPEPEPVVDLGDGRYRISGDLAVRDWAEAFDFPLEHGRISTVGGFVTSLLGRIARVGDCATCRNLTFTVEAMQGRRIAALTLARQEARP